MEMTSTSGTIGLLSKIFRPWVVTLIVLGSFFGFTAWNVSQSWFDHSLPSSAIQARQLQVNSAQLQQLSKSLDSYHHPLAAPDFSTSVFNAIPKS